jgi:hypothetical protein
MGLRGRLPLLDAFVSASKFHIHAAILSLRDAAGMSHQRMITKYDSIKTVAMVLDSEGWSDPGARSAIIERKLKRLTSAVELNDNE